MPYLDLATKFPNCKVAGTHLDGLVIRPADDPPTIGTNPSNDVSVAFTRHPVEHLDARARPHAPDPDRAV